MYLIRFRRNLTKKDRFESAKYEITFFFLLVLPVLEDFRPIWIQTQEKKFDPDPEKTRIRNTDKIGFTQRILFPDVVRVYLFKI